MINKSTLKELVKGTLFAAGMLSFVYFASIKPRENHEQRLKEIYNHSITIKVQSGDSLDKFVKQYTDDCNCGLNYLEVRNKIEEKNNLSNSTIHIGQKLEIPIYKGELK